LCPNAQTCPNFRIPQFPRIFYSGGHREAAFLAFLPQFVDPAHGPVHWQVLILGLTFMGLGILSDGLFAIAAGTAGEFLRRSARFQQLLRWFSGTSFLIVGVAAALSSRK